MCEVYTASASIHYLVMLGNARHQIATVLGISDLPDIEKGYRPYTKWEYMKLINTYPMLEHSVEYYENIDRLSDEAYEDERFEMEKII